MPRYLLVIVVLFALFYSCKPFRGQNRDDYNVLKYIAPIAKSNYTKKDVFLMEIPKNGAVDKNTNKLYSNEVEYRITHPDSALLYITNTYFDGGELNLKNRIHAEIGGYHRDFPFDTLRNQGVQENGLFWKEYVLGDIAIGYLNVSKKNKELFDKSVESVKKR